MLLQLLFTARNPRFFCCRFFVDLDNVNGDDDNEIGDDEEEEEEEQLLSILFF